MEVEAALKDLCNLVALQSAEEIVKAEEEKRRIEEEEERRRIEEEERIRVEEEERRRAEVIDPLAFLAHIRTHTNPQAEAARLARERIVAEIQGLPLDFRRKIVTTLLPDIEGSLEPAIECFVCYSELDFAQYNAIRFLTCCHGGSFTCGKCVRDHQKDFNHTMVGELGVVRQTALIRKALELK